MHSLNVPFHGKNPISASMSSDPIRMILYIAEHQQKEHSKVTQTQDVYENKNECVYVGKTRFFAGSISECFQM